MILGWKNIDAFKRHMEEMELFRRAHTHLVPDEQIKADRAVAAPLNNHPPCRPEYVTGFIDDTGKEIVVPIWDLSLPKGTQN